MKELTIHPNLWRGDTLDARLRHHFADIRTTEGFKEFIAERRNRDPTAEIIRWRRRYTRLGDPVLGVEVKWRGGERQWRFPVVSTFTVPDDGTRHLVFDALLPRIGLDLGIAVQVEMFEALQEYDLAA